MPCPDPEFGSLPGPEERRFCAWLKAIEEAVDGSTDLRSKRCLEPANSPIEIDAGGNVTSDDYGSPE